MLDDIYYFQSHSNVLNCFNKNDFLIKYLLRIIVIIYYKNY